MHLNYELVRGTKVVDAAAQGEFILRAGTLFDGESSQVRHHVDILVRNGRIAQVLPAGGFEGAEYPCYDCSDKFVMPGLIEAHLHLSGMHTQEPYRRYFENNDVRLIRALGHAEELLAHGYTTVREMGAKGRGVGIREGIAKGLCHGPRILTSIEFLSPTGGHGDWPILPYEFVKENSLRSILVDGPDQCVHAVRYLLREGADVVKIVTATGNFGQPYDRMKFRACFSLKEILAMSDEAHEQGKKIAAHVVGAVGVKNALDGNIDTLEHCFFNYEQAPELLERIVEKGVTVVPTMSIIKWFGEYEDQIGNHEAADRFRYNLEKHGKVYLREELKSMRDDYAYWLDIVKLDDKAYGNQKLLARYRVLANSTTGNKKKLIKKQWRFYRDYLKLGVFKSGCNLIRWGIMGLKKYKGV